MDKRKKTSADSTLFTILIWGGMWGIFEATVGYLLHLVSFSMGWLVWYPVACFFMLNVYRRTRGAAAVLLVGLLAAGVKMLNLFLPGRIDKVLNPAVSIVFEALAMAAGIAVAAHFLSRKQESPGVKAIAVLCMNTGWRVLYALYLLFLVPDWIREASVVGSLEAFISFFFIQNLLTCLVLLFGFLTIRQLLRPIRTVERKLSVLLSAFPGRAAAAIRITAAVCLLGGSVALELLL